MVLLLEIEVLNKKKKKNNIFESIFQVNCALQICLPFKLLFEVILLIKNEKSYKIHNKT